MDIYLLVQHLAGFDLSQLSASDVSAILLGGISMLVAAICNYWKKARDWYLGLPHQGIVMYLGMVGLGFIWFGVSCSPLAPYFDKSLICDSVTAVKLIEGAGIAILGNQGAYHAMKLKGELRSSTSMQNGENQ